jgi:hypothetical protein
MIAPSTIAGRHSSLATVLVMPGSGQSNRSRYECMRAACTAEIARKPLEKAAQGDMQAINCLADSPKAISNVLTNKAIGKG